MFSNTAPRRARRWLPATVVASLAVGLPGAAPASAAPVALVRCPAQNLQTAINAAAPGSTVLVTGTCTGNFNVIKHLTLIGLGGAVLDGNHTGTTVTVASGVRAQLTNLTITHGNGPGNGGGGVLNSGTLTLTRSTVSDNTTMGNGGGIYNNFGSTVTLTSSSVSANTTPNGFAAGIYSNGTASLTNSTVSGNTAFEGAGGIANIGANADVLAVLVLTRSQVRDNTAGGQGGGILNIEGTARLTSSAVTGNRAGAGGGIFKVGDGSVVLTRSRVSGNTPDNCEPPGSVPGCTG
ncbi:right-handed parallel beta-helix repeat-containing protein [Streptomyces sp. NPDC051133]|uniref:right-handed parallel beta-helix repeat-containing protein n=1 Tax=Streptomyces sp. NPDC051133 TaxID=3155521 RepID=UPI003439056E